MLSIISSMNALNFLVFDKRNSSLLTLSKVILSRTKYSLFYYLGNTINTC